MPYRIGYTYDARDHLAGLTARQRRTAVDTVDRQLSHEPALETRNRKRLRGNPLASWELRVGDLRVYYDVEETPEPLVAVVAVGVKDRDRVRVAGEEIEL